MDHFNFQEADRSFQEKRESWKANKKSENIDKCNAFIRAMIPIIHNRIIEMLGPNYVVTKENSWPPKLYAVSTKYGELSGWEIGSGVSDGWGETSMMLTTDGGLFSFRERLIRRAKFLGFVDIDSPANKQKPIRKWGFECDLGNQLAYKNIYNFAKDQLNISMEDIEAIRKAVGPPTELEDEAVMSKANIEMTDTHE